MRITSNQLLKRLLTSATCIFASNALKILLDNQKADSDPSELTAAYSQINPKLEFVEEALVKIKTPLVSEKSHASAASKGNKEGSKDGKSKPKSS